MHVCIFFKESYIKILTETANTAAFQRNVTPYLALCKINLEFRKIAQNIASK
jgi:hypothetical protein